MYPDLTDNTKKYLGARSPEDSPYDDPRIKVYLVKSGYIEENSSWWTLLPAGTYQWDR